MHHVQDLVLDQHLLLVDLHLAVDQPLDFGLVLLVNPYFLGKEQSEKCKISIACLY